MVVFAPRVSLASSAALTTASAVHLWRRTWPEWRGRQGRMLLVAMPFVPFVAFLFLVVRPGAPSSVLAPSSDAGAPSSVLAPGRIGGYTAGSVGRSMSFRTT